MMINNPPTSRQRFVPSESNTKLSFNAQQRSQNKSSGSKGKPRECFPPYWMFFIAVFAILIWAHYQPIKITDEMLSVINSVDALKQNIKISKISSDNTQGVANDQVKRKKRLAYVITITKDGYFGLDGAAVLAYSIINSSSTFSRLVYDISFIALVHPNVTVTRPGLKRLGFHVIEVPIPINTSAIRYTFLREGILKNGCCGASELIKLTAYRLLRYDRIIHLDADTMFLNPIDELFVRNYSLIYTTDPNMATFKGDDKMPVQGGFVVLRPSMEDYRNIITILMNVDFVKWHGWNNSNIGWFWGGMTFQGVLPYYYNRVSAPGRSQIIDRCVYNTMADTEECRYHSLSAIKSAHFTVCQKPWGCHKEVYTITHRKKGQGDKDKWEINPLCHELHQKWFELRREAERFFDLPVIAEPCPHGGEKYYQPMQLSKAKLPSEEVLAALGVRPDDSDSRIDPISESMYTSN